MFTGIVEEMGEVVSFVEAPEAWHLSIRANLVCEDLQLGDSIAVNGCCLTVTAIDGHVLRFDILEQTIRCTSFQLLKPGLHVNLERAMASRGRFGGHFVSGHVDAVGTVEVFKQDGKNWYLKLSQEGCSDKYIVEKGSITLDGISLTVAEVHKGGFAVWLIPHTLEVTQLSERKIGDLINLEYDMLAKYVEKILENRTHKAES